MCAETPARGAFLALIKCPDCQREVSDLASAYPHCGRPNPTDDTEETRKLLAEMVRQGVPVDSEEVRKLRKLLREIDQVERDYLPYAESPGTIDGFQAYMDFRLRSDELLDRLRDEYRPYLDALHHRFIWRRRLAKLFVSLVVVPFILLVIALWIRGFGLMQQLASSGRVPESLVLFVYGWLGFGAAAGVTYLGTRLYVSLHRRLTGYEPQVKRPLY